ncbi:DUF402 domain-containing protein [Nocardioides sp. Soil805]|uniref:DUF402 domain-containing protein n=1 Tax=Nocardioides sp. Soil805 TaxID=1736416 RepID=UPI0007034F8C|nr:DUF402 domain-containing protein [Nocardioides sp. Soil805]KRF36910.1 hypothetical protein ASG94_05820 [Nocardioides sp. Soil805]
MTHAPGTRVRCEMTKWGGTPHWEYDAVVLGEDEHGLWLGFAAGTTYTRPGHTFVLDIDHVGLVPAADAWHLATFYAVEGTRWPLLEDSAVEVYVDMTTPAEWDGTTLRAVDLDLDVVRGFNGMVIVDDEDEFAEHQVAYGYPDEVVAGARASCEAVLAAVRGGHAPYDGASRTWLEVLSALR